VLESFSISRTAYSGSTRDALHEEIQSRTGDVSATLSIMRSMERFGSDESILHYEMVPHRSSRGRHRTAQTEWTVRAPR
jgi:hypothetical protein